jgi:hypothetical protein
MSEGGCTMLMVMSLFYYIFMKLDDHFYIDSAGFYTYNINCLLDHACEYKSRKISVVKTLWTLQMNVNACMTELLETILYWWKQ